MDQAAKKVYVSSTMHRTFGRAQWQQLRDLLHSWKSNVSLVQEGMKSITAAQLELLNQQ
jgi:translation initiation factor 3 subunit M